MSTILQPVITSAGLAAVFRAQQSGFKAKITKIGIGSGVHQVDENTTNLKAERYRLDIDCAEYDEANKQLHLTVRDDSKVADDGFFVNEVGFYTEEEVNGQIRHVLFAVYSAADPIAYKSNDIDLLLAFDLTLTGVPGDAITIIDKGVDFNILIAPELAKMARSQIMNMYRHLKQKFALIDKGIL
ncbi:phage tail protein [Pseudoalteromonas luteoviolacea]|uniref:Phage tail fibre protein N-terminal domain-containing protein n=1 Tax=Pseudoalteromonas luteoviolacea S4054 TaxID=1129367 RepID=A0A0F6AA73_9GAMM|nr:phage tail protein [Pseudoalteromonas luteoviolacea]KKE83080.1 hypothetical protein N479_15515 [Pseudoalteromonas luteoviolacea S4054]KZN73471.1 hypothetical protein N481_12180 [Pseudoalteromonas luteoviolacea S4047-1]